MLAASLPDTLLGSSAKQKTIACETMQTDGKDALELTTHATGAKADKPMVEGLTD